MNSRRASIGFSFMYRRLGVRLASGKAVRRAGGMLKSRRNAASAEPLMAKFESILGTVGNTPSVRINRLASGKAVRRAGGMLKSRRNAASAEPLMAKFDSILGTVGNTPSVRINRLAPDHVKLFVKIEAFNPLGSVKDRLALGVIEAAEKSGELKPGQTVIEATSGNTGIGLAMVCAAKGYPLVVTMAETFSMERRKLMRFLGAKVVLTPQAGRAMAMGVKAVELARTHGWFLT